MSVFNIDFECLSEAIESYESLITNMENCSSSLISATSNINEEAYSGDDANVLRNNWSIQSGQVMPSAINQINFAKNALVDAREEFAACKRYCNNFGNVFGLNTSTGLWIQGRLKCDYDSLNEALDYCKKIEIGCKDISDNASDTKREFIGLHNSYNNIYSRIDGFQTKVNDIGGSISVHGSDLGTYGAMVADADDRLNSKFKELLFSNLDFAKEYMLSSPDAYAAGTKIGLRGLLDDTDPLSLLLTALTDGSEALDDEQKQLVLDYLDEKMHQGLTDPITGQLIHSPFEQLTYDERELYVKYFEDLNPDMVKGMDNIENAFRQDGYEGWEIDANNIKFLLYLADEPVRSLYLNYAGEVQIADLSLDPEMIEYHKNGSIFLDHTKMDEDKNGEMAYHSFFHEFGHYLDYKIGSMYGPDVWFSEYYTTDVLSNYVLQDVLFDDVKNTISETFDEKWEKKKSVYLATGNYNNYSGQKWLFEKKDEYKERVMDALINQLDYNAFGTPYFGESEDDKVAQDLYNSVRSQIYADIHKNKIAKDIYGMYTGNSVNNHSGHSVILNQWDPEKATACELYHIESGDMSSYINPNGSDLKVVLDDGTELYLDPDLNYLSDYSSLDGDYKQKESDFADKIIQSEGNLVHNSNAGKEFLANDLAAAVTQNPDRLSDFEYFDDTTIAFADGLIEQMANH